MNYTFVKKNSFLIFAISIFLAVNLLFNINLWKEVLVNNQNSTVINDSTNAEFVLENYYQNILHFKNPFVIENKIIYPFEVNMSLNDPGITYLAYVFLLRPFLNIHQTLLLILIFSSLITNLSMFFLLKKLNINKYIALIMGLSFGYTQLMAYKMIGHYTYTTIYFFPLIFLILLTFFKAATNKKKILLSAVFGIFMGLGLLQNFYYFTGAVICLILYFFYYFIFLRLSLLKFLADNLKYIVVSAISFMILLTPWFYAVYRMIMFENSEKISSLHSSIFYSGDLIGWLTPSEYNPFYHVFLNKLSSLSRLFQKYNNFYLHNGSKFIFPGMLILIVYFYLVFYYRKLSAKIKQKIRPHFFISFFFAVLLLGPFLKVFNRWELVVDEAIAIVFPLPFLILSFVPGMSDLRAPTRFEPIFVFLASLVTAYILHYVFLRLSRLKKKLIIGSLILVFFIDQYYILPDRYSTPVPKTAYDYIKKDSEQATVFEIPFNVRDGFQYIGFVHALSPINGSIQHGKPIIGGYFARVSSSVFTYYKNLPFINYTAQIIDKGNYNPLKEKPNEVKIIPFTLNIDEVIKELNFFDIKYILLKNDEKYSPVTAEILPNLGFTQKMKDGKYDLYERKLKKEDFTNIKFGEYDDYLYTASGFSAKEDGFRWTEGKIAKLFIKNYDLTRKKLSFEVESFVNSQNIDIIVNDKYLGKKRISTEKYKYSLDVSNKLNPGLNTIIFKFSQNHKPSKVLLNSKDERNLAVKFYTLKIE